MILQTKSSYLGLDHVETSVLDTSKLSPDYLRIDSIPDELTAGNNVIKLSGTNKFKEYTQLYVEALDSSGVPITTNVPNYIDTNNRKFIILTIDETTAPGFATIYICGTLKDASQASTPSASSKINFKWQYSINVSPFKNNETEIIFDTPPVAIMNTLVKPIPVTTYRNNEQAVILPIANGSYQSHTFDDYIGDSDSSTGIHAPKKAHAILKTAVSSSITSTTRETVYYLAEENYTAKRVVKNIPVFIPRDIIVDSTMNGALLNIATPENISPTLQMGEYIISGSYIGNVEKVASSTVAGLYDKHIVTVNISGSDTVTPYVGLYFDFSQKYNKVTTPITVAINGSGGTLATTADINNAILGTDNLYKSGPLVSLDVSTAAQSRASASIAELDIYNLKPLCGDISNINVSIRPTGYASKYIDLGNYSTKPVDTLMDTNYTNAVEYVDSPYLLTGYFNPVLLPETKSLVESSSFMRANLFSASNWVLDSSSGAWAGGGSNVSSYTLTQGEKIEILERVFNGSQSEIYLAFTGSGIPSKNYYGAFNYVASYMSIFVSASLGSQGAGSGSGYEVKFAIFTQSAGVPTLLYPLATSSVWHPTYYPYDNSLDNGKAAGRITETLQSFVTRASSINRIYPGIILRAQQGTQPYYTSYVKITDFIYRELGSREYIQNLYWYNGTNSNPVQTYGVASVPLNTLGSTSVNYSGNTVHTSISNSFNDTILADSVGLTFSDYLTARSSSAKAIFALNSRNGRQKEYTFYENTEYTLTFNCACSLQEKGTGAILDIENNIPTSVPQQNYTNLVSTTSGNGTGATFDVSILSGMGGNTALIAINNPGINYRIGDIIYIAGSLIGGSDPADILSFQVTEVDWVAVPKSSSLNVWGRNYNADDAAILKYVPFQTNGLPTTNSSVVGELIGELTATSVDSNGKSVIKQFGQIEMDFKPVGTGTGEIGFEYDAFGDWYISEISVKEKARVGQTPNHTKLFVKIPNEYLGSSISVKIEYMNDKHIKAAYSTILTDITLTNINNSGGSGSIPIQAGGGTGEL